MKIISVNINGLRAAARKGFLSWLKKEKADIVCLQEIKAGLDQLPWDLIRVTDYQFYLNGAEKRGYSGVAVYSRRRPERIIDCLGFARFDREGRILILEYSDFILINLYFPHGGRGKENLNYKLKSYNLFFKFLKKRQTDKEIILAGDFNIAHQEIDLARPRENRNNIMFTPEERRQISRLINFGFIDSFRYFYPQRNGCYTWWPYGFNARERNLGWRIDYLFVSLGLRSRLKKAFIRKEITLSDHAPIGIELN